MTVSSTERCFGQSPEFHELNASLLLDLYYKFCSYYSASATTSSVTSFCNGGTSFIRPKLLFFFVQWLVHGEDVIQVKRIPLCIPKRQMLKRSETNFIFVHHHFLLVKSKPTFPFCLLLTLVSASVLSAFVHPFQRVISLRAEMHILSSRCFINRV
ncbi:hypothetical protein BDP27DRAFT_234835 [Rhodocollybia butyracea]|uniref:Uncharacterized protein n=1 Tax=Rhodocollybia butyracea TaxID=206335 RepID=A0A9P5TW90_9AGAR|nr:hypothetical protein BDP27DRAFT_234835 [Rhodocollybia butyracea]